ncbi:MAG: nucleotidyl transferase AbiEii/AbiGii toxin family protein [Rhodothermia bacterium]|nr:MAG: nucleotidyl transferase AbiEii/AbiGii toxin family protein [Rhodothermia bacterium]
MNTDDIRRRLRKRANEIGLEFQQAVQYYAIERFLYRLSRTVWVNKLIVKGATMLRVWEGAVARPTRDIDFLGNLDNNIKVIQGAVADCLNANVPEDGLVFDQSTTAERIALESRYPGIRVKIRGDLAGARFILRLDIGIDDAVVPKPGWVDYPVLLGGPTPRILAYSPASSVAEKFETMVKLGLVNSRLKDYFDIWMLATTQSFNGIELTSALRATFERRETPLPTAPPVALTSEFVNQAASRKRWANFCEKLTESAVEVPDDLGEIVILIVEFLGPVLQEAGSDSINATWYPGRGWE